jgi:hypothetical protein
VLTATDPQGASSTAKVSVVVAAAPGAVDRTAPKVLRATRSGASAVVLTFSEDVVGLGSSSIVAAGAGAITRIQYEPRARRATVRFARKVAVSSLIVRGPLADSAGNPVRRTTVKLTG